MSYVSRPNTVFMAVLAVNFCSGLIKLYLAQISILPHWLHSTEHVCASQTGLFVRPSPRFSQHQPSGLIRVAEVGLRQMSEDATLRLKRSVTEQMGWSTATD